MALAKVLFNLALRGITPAKKLFKGKTVLSYNLGEKQLVQMFDRSGKLSKFKIYGKKDGFWLCDSKTIKKGTKIYDDHYYPSVTTTTVKKEAGYPFLTPESTEVFRSEPFPGCKRIEIKKTSGAYGDEVTKINSTKINEYRYIGDIEKTGGLNSGKRSFDTSYIRNQYNGLTNQYSGLTNQYDDFMRLNTQYEDDYARMMRQMDEDNQRMLEQQRQNDDFLTMFGIIGLN